MHVGSAASASQTIFARSRRAHGAKSAAAAAVATPNASASVLYAAAGGAPAAPAAPNLGPLRFARKLSGMNS